MDQPDPRYIEETVRHYTGLLSKILGSNPDLLNRLTKLIQEQVQRQVLAHGNVDTQPLEMHAWQEDIWRLSQKLHPQKGLWGD